MMLLIVVKIFSDSRGSPDRNDRKLSLAPSKEAPKHPLGGSASSA